MSFTRIIMKALTLAVEAHDRQTRKYTFEPYFNHPLRVAQRINSLGYDSKVIAAALLHDVIEDTPVTATMIMQDFGDRVACLVKEVSDPSKEFPYFTRAHRKAIDLEHFKTLSADAQTIKLADMLDNVPSIAKYDKPDFARMYVNEKIAALPHFSKGHPKLFKEASEMLNDFEWRLKSPAVNGEGTAQ